MGSTIELSLAEKPVSADAAVASSILASSTKRLDRSTSTPTEEWLPAPLMKSHFPVCGHHTVLNLRWAYMDADHVGDLTTPVNAVRAWHKGGVAAAPSTR